MKRITISWSGKKEYLRMLFNHVGSQIKKGKTQGMAHGYPWRIEDDGIAAKAERTPMAGTGKALFRKEEKRDEEEERSHRLMVCCNDDGYW